MNGNYILETYNEIVEMNSIINKQYLNFVDECYVLEEISNNEYEIQTSLKLNKNYFQGILSKSDLCNQLNDNNYNEMTLDKLKLIFKQYESTTGNNIDLYCKAIDLYQMADNIEEKIDKKIELELLLIYDIDIEITKIQSTDLNKLLELYKKIENYIKENFLKTNIITQDDFNKCIYMLNDIFNYFINGYPNLPLTTE